MRFLVVNGPNLNLLGRREPEIYGSETLTDLERRWRHHASRHAVGIDSYQSNHEGELIDALQAEASRVDGVIINPGALSHYSYALHDTLVAIGKPVVEVHISNIHEREEWRRTSVTAPAADLVIVGRGADGYLHAIDHLWAAIAHPPTTVSYGTDGDHAVDLRVPAAPTGTAVLLHGGFWRRVWARDIMDPLAVFLTTRGWATANVEYRRGPASFPKATADVRTAMAWLADNAAEHGVPVDPTVVIGHSAGGYLAARLAMDTSFAGAVAMGPVLDLEAVSRERPDDDPIAAFLGAGVGEDPDVWERAGFGRQNGFTTPLWIIHGSDDESIPVDHSRSFASRFDDVTLVEAAGADHMAVVDPHDAAIHSLVDTLERISPPTARG